jgi:hypothetical protein
MANNKLKQQVQPQKQPENPWWAIMASTPITEQGFRHKVFGSAPKPADPPEGLSPNQRMQYFKAAILIEQDCQLCMLPCIITVDPRTVDKSYAKILEATYELWGDKVMTLIRDSHEQDPDLTVPAELLSALNSPEDLRQPGKQLVRLFDFVKLLLETHDEDYKSLAHANQSDQDKGPQIYCMVAKMVLELMKNWTEEWEGKRKELEKAYWEVTNLAD